MKRSKPKKTIRIHYDLCFSSKRLQLSSEFTFPDTPTRIRQDIGAAHHSKKYERSPTCAERRLAG